MSTDPRLKPIAEKNDIKDIISELKIQYKPSKLKHYTYTEFTEVVNCSVLI